MTGSSRRGSGHRGGSFTLPAGLGTPPADTADIPRGDLALRALYGQSVVEPASRRDCPSPEALGAVTRGSAPEQHRLATLDHAMGCRACQRDFVLLFSVAAAAQTPGADRGRLADC